MAGTDPSMGALTDALAALGCAVGRAAAEDRGANTLWDGLAAALTRSGPAPRGGTLAGLDEVGDALVAAALHDSAPTGHPSTAFAAAVSQLRPRVRLEVPEHGTLVARRQDVCACLVLLLVVTQQPDRPWPRTTLACAVRCAAEWFAAAHPGHAVEIRIPPFAAVQAIAGPSHTRGTPPAVVECDPTTWLSLVSGAETWDAAAEAGRLTTSGERADVRDHFPLRPFG